MAAQTTVHNAYPDKDIYFTEITGGDWATNFGDNLVWNFQNILIGGDPQLVEDGDPLESRARPEQRSSSGRLHRLPRSGDGQQRQRRRDVQRRVLCPGPGHQGRPVERGAHQLDDQPAAVNTVAFLNPDGSRSSSRSIPDARHDDSRLYDNGKHFNYQIPASRSPRSSGTTRAPISTTAASIDGGFHQGGGSLDAWTIFGNHDRQCRRGDRGRARRRQVAEALWPVQRRRRIPPASRRASASARATGRSVARRLRTFAASTASSGPTTRRR